MTIIRGDQRQSYQEEIFLSYTPGVTTSMNINKILATQFIEYVLHDLATSFTATQSF